MVSGVWVKGSKSVDRWERVPGAAFFAWGTVTTVDLFSVTTTLHFYDVNGVELVDKRRKLVDGEVVWLDGPSLAGSITAASISRGERAPSGDSSVRVEGKVLR